MRVIEQFNDWHQHSSVYGFYERLQEEYRTELVRVALHRSKLPLVSIRVDTKLKRLMGFK
jgi:hypothetical protein